MRIYMPTGFILRNYSIKQLYAKYHDKSTTKHDIVILHIKKQVENNCSYLLYKSTINQFCIDYFRCTVTNIVHLPHPQHLILCFELLSHTFLFGKLFY